MATFLQHSLLRTGRLFLQKYDFSAATVNQVRYKCILPCKRRRPKYGPKIESMAKSLEQKGYLRAHKSYTPPENVAEIVDGVRNSLKLKGKHFTPESKFQFLTLCAKEFQVSVPNSQLFEMNTTADVIRFYNTPVNPILPLDDLKKADLPPNLHIQSDYIRFHPDTDNKFGGETAFPKSSTIVSGLKYKKKYAGHIAKTKWP